MITLIDIMSSKCLIFILNPSSLIEIILNSFLFKFTSVVKVFNSSRNFVTLSKLLLLLIQSSIICWLGSNLESKKCIKSIKIYLTNNN